MINSQCGVQTGRQCVKSGAIFIVGFGSAPIRIIVVRPLQLLRQVVGWCVQHRVGVVITALIGYLASLAPIAWPLTIALKEKSISWICYLWLTSIHWVQSR